MVHHRLFFKIKFYWNTVMVIYLWLVCGCFDTAVAKWVVAIEPICGAHMQCLWLQTPASWYTRNCSDIVISNSILGVTHAAAPWHFNFIYECITHHVKTRKVHFKCHTLRHSGVCFVTKLNGKALSLLCNNTITMLKNTIYLDITRLHSSQQSPTHRKAIVRKIRKF